MKAQSGDVLSASQLPITVELGKLPGLPELAERWRELEGRASPSFFLTWSWIGNWLVSLGDHARHGMLVTARQGGRVVGLAVLFDAPIRRRLLPLGRAVHVNETGIAAFDALYIEYNGCLVEAGNVVPVQQTMLAHACGANGSWRELRLRHAAGDGLAPLGATPGKLRQRAEVRESRFVDLERIRKRGGDYLGLLSANRRAHIRRSLRAYAALGEVTLTCADSIESALGDFDRLVWLHEKRWAGRGLTSAFNSSFCRGFHERLISHGLPRGEVQLLRVRAGERDIGYLYNFVHDGHVYFYQSGYDYRLIDGRQSPGLVTLALAIEYNARHGMKVFDFLAGDQAYKASLGTDRTVMTSWTVHRHSWLSSVEQGLARAVGAARAFLARLRVVFAKGSAMRAVALALLFGAITAVMAEILDPERKLLRAVMSLAGRY